MAKVILGFVGPIAAGKGASCEYLVKKHRAGYHRFSTILRDIVDRLHLQQERDTLQKISTILRGNFGDDVLAKTLALDVKQDLNELVVVDGVRRLPDIKYLTNLPHFYLVAINAEEKTRYERMRKRDENPGETTKTFAEFKVDGKQESEWQVENVMQQAIFVIDNNGSFEALHQQIDDILNKTRAGMD